MGREYRLRFHNDDVDQGAGAIAALAPLQDAIALSAVELELRAPSNSSKMPDAFVRVEPGGLYFCDNGGAGRDYLGRVVTKLIGRYGPVTIEDLE